MSTKLNVRGRALTSAAAPGFASEADLVRAAAEQLPVGVLAFDSERRLRWMNAKGKAFLAQAPVDALGLPWRCDTALIDRVLAGETVALEPIVLSGADGVARRCAARLSPLSVRDGSLGMLCVLEPTAAADANSPDSQLNAILRAITRNTSDLLLLVDRERRIRYLNRALDGVAFDDALGRDLFDFIPPEHHATLESAHDQARRTGSPVTTTIPVPLPDDAGRIVEYRAQSIADAGFEGALSIVATNVTERQRAETAAHEAEAILHTLGDNSADWMVLLDRDLRCVFINRGIGGITAKQIIGLSVKRICPPEDLERVTLMLTGALTHGDPGSFLQHYDDPELGRRFFELRYRPVRSPAGIVGVVVNITEVTERRQADEQLRTQGNILEMLREGVLLVDAASYLIRLANPAAELLLGYGPGELVGRSGLELVAISDVQRERMIEEARASGSASLGLPVELVARRKDGTHFVAACVVRAVALRGVEHWLFAITDVTERRRLEREILEALNREQQRIGSDLHDGLGQDLTGVALMLRGIAGRLERADPAVIDDIEEAIGLVNGSIEEARTLARGLCPVGPERGGLYAALESLTARRLDRAGVEVRFAPRVTRRLELDENSATHLYRIAQEAVTNAMRHGRPSRIDITLELVNDDLRMTIEDDGVGLGAGKATASGLGLKIMRYRARMLGGEVVIEPRSPSGVRVRCQCNVRPREAG